MAKPSPNLSRGSTRLNPSPPARPCWWSRMSRSCAGVILEMLEEQGYRTIEAVNGPSALNILRLDAPIDLLVTDIGLPA